MLCTPLDSVRAIELLAAAVAGGFSVRFIYGSSKHDLHGEDLTILKTDSSETGVEVEMSVGSELQCHCTMIKQKTISDII